MDYISIHLSSEELSVPFENCRDIFILNHCKVLCCKEDLGVPVLDYEQKDLLSLDAKIENGFLVNSDSKCLY